MFSGHLKFYGFLKKDILLLYKRRKYLVMFILLPLLISALFLLFLGAKQYTIDVAVCNYDSSYESRAALNKIELFRITYLEGGRDECLPLLREKVSSGEFSMGIEVPSDFSSSIQNLKQTKVSIYYDNTDVAFSNLLSWKVEQSLEPFERQIVDAINSDLTATASTARASADVVFEAVRLPSRFSDAAQEIDRDLKNLEELDTEFILNPVWVEHKPLTDTSASSSALAFIFPILALFVILMLASTSIIYDRKSLFITRVKSSTTPLLYILAKVVFFILLTLVQFLIIYLLFIATGASYSFDLWSVLELVVIVGVMNCLIGFLIGIVSENEGIAVLFSLVISFPLMLVSGIFYPVQALPGFIAAISNALPLNYQISAAKSVLLFGGSPSSSWVYICGVLFVLVYYLVKRRL